MTGIDSTRSETTSTGTESGYGSPTPEDEVPNSAATNPGSPDPTLGGQESDAEALRSDKSLGAPEKNFF